MTTFLDTNILVRHFTGDPPAQARRATSLLAAATDLHLTDVVAAETVYVLESFYEVPPADTARLLRSAVAFEAVTVDDEDRLLRALEIYELHAIDFTDCYLAACAEIDGQGLVASFDRDIDKVQTVTKLEPR
ncbi:MAG: type II toxin-antitoxin system VapC family toxin [Actinobacteria bacterium]|nr:type II toxin-antitoxin system VapC family toxin [Actinomycetota bacterium]